MIERVVILVVLAVVAVIAYRLLRANHIRKAGAAANGDPILADLIPGLPAIVYFTTPTCLPCKTRQQPALERLQAEVGQRIQVIRIDASEQLEAAQRWGVFSAPTTFILDGSGRPREVNHGVADADLLKRQLELAGM